jgi:hypothetical protein
VAGELRHRSRAATGREPEISTQDTDSTPSGPLAEASFVRSFETCVGVAGRWREYRAERKRRRLVQALRRAAVRALETHPNRQQVLLRYRVAAVRPDLLEIAAMLEHTQAPNPVCLATLSDLLTNGRDSPFYNPRVPVAELHTTLDDIRSEL